MKLMYKGRENLSGYLFLSPVLIGFFGFTLYAIIFSLYMSFTDWDMLRNLRESEFIGFQNYIDTFTDPWVRDSFLNNLFFLLLIPIQMSMALLIAVVLNKNIVGRNLIRSAFYIPYITSWVAVTLIFFQLFMPNSGLVNIFLKSIGVTNTPGWLGSSAWVKPAIMLMMIWKNVGYQMILFLAGLQGISSSLYEAATIDGANERKKFWYITIPMISPVTFFIVITGIISNFKEWSIIQMTTKGGPGSSSSVIGYYVYKSAFEHLKMGYASAISWLLLIVVLIVTLVQWRQQKRWVN